MRIAEARSMELTRVDNAVQRASTVQASHKSGVSREERLHLLAGKMNSPAKEASSEIYGERAQLLSNTSAVQRSWVA